MSSRLKYFAIALISGILLSGASLLLPLLSNNKFCSFPEGVGNNLSKTEGLPVPMIQREVQCNLNITCSNPEGCPSSKLTKDGPHYIADSKISVYTGGIIIDVAFWSLINGGLIVIVKYLRHKK